MLERNFERPKYPIGAKVPILQHTCIGGGLGTWGKVTELDRSNNPTKAECNDCHKITPVDQRALTAKR